MALAVVLAACGSDAPGSPGRVLVVGLDGASPRVVDFLIGAGRLPNLADLARRGAHGPLLSDLPLYSPRIWTSIATGRRPRAHGIKGFVARRPGPRRLVTSRERRVPALWNIASERGSSVALVNWWVTYPPERVRGVVVSDHFLPGVARGRAAFFDAEVDTGSPLVHPPEWEPRLREVIAAADPAGGADPFADLPELRARDKVRSAYREDAQVAALATEVARELHPDLLMVLFKGVDVASHHLWAGFEPPEHHPASLKLSEAERASAAEALYRVYAHSDALLGELLAGYAADDLVLVVSDHGFHVDHTKRGLTGQHRTPAAKEAILYAAGDRVRAGATTEGVTIYDITPTILAWLGWPLADDMPGRPAGFLEATANARIASYDGTPVDRWETSARGEEDEILERLSALGYLEEGESEPPARSGDH